MSNTVLLGKYTKIKTGKLDANASSENGQYPFFTCSQIPLKIDSYSYDCECVLVAGNGELNTKYYEGKFDAYQRTYIIESLDKQSLSVKYLYYFLDKYVERLREMSIGGVIKYIKLGYLTEAKIPLPPLSIQQSIADILDRTSALIEERKAQIAKLDLLVKARFVEMFGDPVTNPMGWEMKRLGECGSLKNGMNFSQHDTGYIIRCLGVGDFKDFYTIEDISVLSEINLSATPAADYLLRDGDIVFVRSNGNRELVGRSVEVFPKSGELTFSGFCIRYRNESPELSTVYLNHALHLSTLRAALLSDGRGANIQNINQQMLASLAIPLPPLRFQTRFADFVQQTDKSKFEIQQGLERLDVLYKALMQEYFRCDIREDKI